MLEFNNRCACLWFSVCFSLSDALSKSDLVDVAKYHHTSRITGYGFTHSIQSIHSATIHYLRKCWLITRDFWHSPQSEFTRRFQDIDRKTESDDYTFICLLLSPLPGANEFINLSNVIYQQHIILLPWHCVTVYFQHRQPFVYKHDTPIVKMCWMCSTWHYNYIKIH